MRKPSDSERINMEAKGRKSLSYHGLSHCLNFCFGGCWLLGHFGSLPSNCWKSLRPALFLPNIAAVVWVHGLLAEGSLTVVVVSRRFRWRQGSNKRKYQVFHRHQMTLMKRASWDLSLRHEHSRVGYEPWHWQPDSHWITLSQYLFLKLPPARSLNGREQSFSSVV